MKSHFWTGTTSNGVDLYFFLLKLNRFNKYIIHVWQNAVSEAIITTPISNWSMQCLNVLVKDEIQWQTREQNPVPWVWALCSNCRKHFCSNLYPIHSVLTLREMEAKIFSLKIGQKVIVHLFQETSFCHICTEQGQETLKPWSVVL